MYMVVSGFLASTPENIIAFIPHFEVYRDTLSEAIATIMEMRLIQERSSKGTTEMKKKRMADLVAVSLSVGRKVRAYAINENNAELERTIDYSQWDLEHCADTILLDRCRVIHSETMLRMDLLSDYGITADLLERLQKAIGLFEEMAPKPQLNIVTKKDATAELARVFSETDAALYKMDRVFEMAREEYAEFFGNFKNNRQLTDAGYRKLSVLGRIRDSDGNSVEKVTVDIAGTALRVMSGPKGIYKMKGVAPGNYKLLFKKSGYTEQVVAVSIHKGERCRADVVLERAAIE